MLKDKKDILVVLASVGALVSGIIAVVSYFNAKEHRKLEAKNAELEYEINQLHLSKLKNGNNNTNGNV